MEENDDDIERTETAEWSVGVLDVLKQFEAVLHHAACTESCIKWYRDGDFLHSDRRTTVVLTTRRVVLIISTKFGASFGFLSLFSFCRSQDWPQSPHYGPYFSTVLYSLYSSMSFLMLTVSVLWCFPPMTAIIFYHVVQVNFSSWFPPTFPHYLSDMRWLYLSDLLQQTSFNFCFL